jgi:hypothetical protein
MNRCNPEEVPMTRKSALIAFSLVLLAGLFAVTPSLSVPKKPTMAASQRIDVTEMASASATLASFDDLYERHLGVLDVLRAP